MKRLKWLTIPCLIATLILILANPPFIPSVQASTETFILDVESYSYVSHPTNGWVGTGSSPWIDSQNYPLAYTEESGSGARNQGDFEFEDLPANAENVTQVRVYFYAGNFGSGNSNATCETPAWNSTYGWDDGIWDYEIWRKEGDGWSLDYVDWMEHGTIATVDEVNGAKTFLAYGPDVGTSPMIRLDHLYMNVTADIPPPPPPPQDFAGDYFGTGIFIGGVIMMIYAPSWVAWGVKKKGVTPDTVERAGYAMLIFLLGLGLFLSYIYGGV